MNATAMAVWQTCIHIQLEGMSYLVQIIKSFKKSFRLVVNNSGWWGNTTFLALVIRVPCVWLPHLTHHHVYISICCRTIVRIKRNVQ